MISYVDCQELDDIPTYGVLMKDIVQVCSSIFLHPCPVLLTFRPRISMFLSNFIVTAIVPADVSFNAPSSRWDRAHSHRASWFAVGISIASLRQWRKIKCCDAISRKAPPSWSGTCHYHWISRGTDMFRYMLFCHRRWWSTWSAPHLRRRFVMPMIFGIPTWCSPSMSGLTIIAYHRGQIPTCGGYHQDMT